MFEENLAALVKLASKLPQDACGQTTSTPLTPTPSTSNITMTTTTMATNGTHREPYDDEESDKVFEK